MDDSSDMRLHIDNEPQQPSSPLSALPTEVLQIILDPSPVIERVRHDYRGESGPYMRYEYQSKKDENGNILLDADGKPMPDMEKEQLPVTYWLKSGKPFMNDEGIDEVISLLNKVVNRNTIFSQMTEEEIAKKMLILDYDLIDLFTSKYVEYAIDINRMSIKKDTVLDMCDFAMKQSQNKALIDALTKISSFSEVRDTTKKGFSLGDLSPMKLIHRGEQNG